MLTKQNLLEISNLRDKLQNLVIRFSYRYILKRFGKIQEDRDARTKLYRNFQKDLLEITEWSDKTLTKNYKKFLKWSKRREGLDEVALTNMLHKIIRLSCQIVLNESDVFIETLLQKHEFPTLKSYYYKCLKRIARIIYERPKDIHALKWSMLNEQLENVLQLFVPLDSLRDILNFSYKLDDKDQSAIQIEYDFKNDTGSDSSSISIRPDSQKPLVIDKQPSERSLEYVASDITNIIDNESENDPQNNGSVDSVRHITVPKYKKQQFFYNKPKINEIDENFFND